MLEKIPRPTLQESKTDRRPKAIIVPFGGALRAARPRWERKGLFDSSHPTGTTRIVLRATLHCQGRRSTIKDTADAGAPDASAPAQNCPAASAEMANIHGRPAALTIPRQFTIKDTRPLPSAAHGVPRRYRCSDDTKAGLGALIEGKDLSKLEAETRRRRARRQHVSRCRARVTSLPSPRARGPSSVGWRRA